MTLIQYINSNLCYVMSFYKYCFTTILNNSQYYRKIDVLEKTASEISDTTGNKVNSSENDNIDNKITII